MHESPLPLPPLPARDPRGHKGTFGTVVVFGGCTGPDRHMMGAPALSARAALRAGAGLARLVMPGPILDAGIALCPSATGIPMPVDGDGQTVPHEVSRVFDEQLAACDCLVVGPGLGSGKGPAALALRAVVQEDAPVVIDADALNALAQFPELVRDFHAAAIPTPPPGESRRLAEGRGRHGAPVDPASRPAAAMALAQRLGCIVVLKGSGTVVSDGQRTWVDDRGSGSAEIAADKGTGGL